MLGIDAEPRDRPFDDSWLEGLEDELGGSQARNDQFLSNLAAHIHRSWNAAKLAKEPHERELLRCLRQREGIYEPEILSAIQEQGGSDVYMMLTQLKCRAAEAWIHDILWQPGELPFGVDPTPMPDLPDEVHQEVINRVQQETQQLLQAGIYVHPEEVQKRIEQVESIIADQVNWMAAEKARRMQEHLADILIEGGWVEQTKELISDFVTYPTAFMKGPFTTMAKKLEWRQDEFGTRPIENRKVVRRYARVSPFDIYPAPDARHLNDGYLFERMRLRRKALYDMIGVPGYDEEALRQVIAEYGDTGHKLNLVNDTERDRLEGRQNEEWSNDVTIDVLNFWGQVRGSWLIEWGIDEEQIEDPDDDYEANVMLVGRHIIRAVLNPHPLGHRPYSMASLERVNGKIWGKGMCQILRDLQTMCNATARALANNMALSSGPMVEVQVDRLAEGEGVIELYPWRQFQTTESKVGAGGSAKAINFFQPDSNASELMAVYKFYSSLADEYSGIPPYAHGMNVAGGAASTASGLQMLMNSTARGIKQAVAVVDQVTEQVVKRTFESVMIHDDVEHIKGDLKIVARGSKALLNREQQNVRRTELLQVVTNPIDQELLGLEGRRQLLWDLFKGMDLDPSEILPSKDKIKAMMAAPAMDQGQEGPRKGRETDGAGSVAGGGDLR